VAATGTQASARGAAPPTGRPVALDGLIPDRVEDGRVRERWEQWDQWLMLQQLGVHCCERLRPAATITPPNVSGVDMTRERRYEDHEIRQILDLAIGEEHGSAQSLTAVDGLTLRELQEVGREVGVPPDRITQAAATFEGRGESVSRATSLGLPTSVERVVTLPRNPSDREWELLVAELRTTFGGKGEMTSHGGLREWTHGRVQVFIEPTETGYRLRLTDANAALGGMVLGGGLLAFAVLILVVLLGRDDPGARLAVPAFFSLFGGGLIAGSAISLPKWARRQKNRMEHMCRHAVSLLATPEPNDGKP
jgi:hypothetical protein